MNFLSLLEAKRDGRPLTAAQINEIILAYTAGSIPDYQMAAFLMAVFFRGLDSNETAALTLAMRDSGEMLSFPADPRPLVDKHSTGGVGDKVSLPLAPLLACLDLRVPMISGRGLGITGGTLDKLDSVPGFQTRLPADRIVEIVQSLGCVMCGQTEHMVPADKGLYALRDVTGTIPSQPLIVASILSKKLAENLQALVLDVKFGAAAFMRTRKQARDLARAMVTLGRHCDVNTRAVLSRMDSPVGAAAGNWLEVKEAVACLDGTGPADLRELVLSFAAYLLVQTDKAATLPAGRAQAEACLTSGKPRRKWDDLLAAQGGDVDQFNRRLALDSIAPVIEEVKAPHPGFVAQCDARVIGEVIRDLGGGRLTKESTIDYSVGVDCLAKPGQPVESGSLLCRLHAPDKAQAAAARARLQRAFSIADEPPPAGPLIVEEIAE